MIKTNAYLSIILLLIGMRCHAMGESKEALKEPAFAALNEGDDDIEAVIIDDGKKTELREVSFFGNTAVGGVRRDDDDSMTKLDLTKIKSLKVITPLYQSKRYPEKDFALVRKVAVDGIVTENLLVPRNIIVCGIEKKTGDEESWFLYKIDELQVVSFDAHSSENYNYGTVVKDMTITSTDNVQLKIAQKKHIRNDLVVERVGSRKEIGQALREFLNAIIELVRAMFHTITNFF